MARPTPRAFTVEIKSRRFKQPLSPQPQPRIDEYNQSSGYDEDVPVKRIDQDDGLEAALRAADSFYGRSTTHLLAPRATPHERSKDTLRQAAEAVFLRPKAPTVLPVRNEISSPQPMPVTAPAASTETEAVPVQAEAPQPVAQAPAPQADSRYGRILPALAPLDPFQNQREEEAKKEQEPRRRGRQPGFKLKARLGRVRNEIVLNDGKVADEASLRSVLGVLNDRQRRVFEGRRLTQPPVPVADLGFELGLDISAVYQFEARAVKKVKAALDEKQALASALEHLDENERRVYEARHLAPEPVPVRELAEEIGVSRHHIERIEAITTKKVEAALNPPDAALLAALDSLTPRQRRVYEARRLAVPRITRAALGREFGVSGDAIRDTEERAVKRIEAALNPSPAQETVRIEPSPAVRDVLGVLNERERRIYEARRLTEPRVTFKALGDEFGVHPDTVRQLAEGAINKVDAALDGQPLRVKKPTARVRLEPTPEVAAALDLLNEQERRVYVGRRLTQPQKTLEMIGEEIGVSQPRVRAVERRALEKVEGAIKARQAVGPVPPVSPVEPEQRRPTRPLEGAIDALDERERRIYQARRMTDPPVRRVELAKELGLSPERVRQIEFLVLEKLGIVAPKVEAKKVARPKEPKAPKVEQQTDMFDLIDGLAKVVSARLKVVHAELRPMAPVVLAPSSRRVRDRYVTRTELPPGQRWQRRLSYWARP